MIIVIIPAKRHLLLSIGHPQGFPHHLVLGCLQPTTFRDLHQVVDHHDVKILLSLSHYMPV